MRFILAIATLFLAGAGYAQNAGLPFPVAKDSIKTTNLTINLYNLNPFINQWFILEIAKNSGQVLNRYHLESASRDIEVSLSETGFKLRAKTGNPTTDCQLWENSKFDIQQNFDKFHNPFYPLCDGLFYLRLHRSSDTSLSVTEWGTNLLRSTSFGESIISAVKPYIVEHEGEKGESKFRKEKQPHVAQKDYPIEARMRTKEGQSLVSMHNELGFKLETATQYLSYGRWYRTAMHKGIYTGLFLPNLMADDIQSSYKDWLQPADAKEGEELVYLTAYDLSKYTLRFAVGTTEPPISTAPEIYGPNVFLQKSLVPIGSVPPYDLKNGVAVFVGGFKKRHGTIHEGPLAGRTYGYIQNGTELVPMASDLATMYSTLDGNVQIGLWPSDKSKRDEFTRTVVSARQNGALIIDNGSPGQYLPNLKTHNWHEGNWSADVNGLRRSLRTGVCIQEDESRRFLVFFAFTNATPTTMARVMMAYSCKVAMHLDMNALMYLHNAIYRLNASNNVEVEYLHKDMLWPKNLTHHRFILDNNERDFFYLLPLTP